MNIRFWHTTDTPRPQPHTHRPIYCTLRFKQDIDRIYGNVSRYDDEASAYAHVIAGSAVFYKCDALPEYMMQRQRAAVSTKMDTPEVRKMFIDELKQTQGRSRHVSVHDHPMNFPYLSACDVRTYERCRTSATDPSPFGCNNPYPVVLINLSENQEIELLGFWVNDGYAQPTTINIIPDESEVVAEAWANAPRLAYFSPEAELARNIGKTLPTGWNVTLGVNNDTQQKALLVTTPDGRNKAIPFSDSPLGLEADNLWKYVDWHRLFVDCTGYKSADKPLEEEKHKEATEQLNDVNRKNVENDHRGSLGTENKGRLVFGKRNSRRKKGRRAFYKKHHKRTH